MKLSRLSALWPLAFAAIAAINVGCSSDQGELEDEEGELGLEDSGKVVATAQTDLLLYQGYSTLFDQGHASCVTFGQNLTPQVGDVGVDVRISLVKSREELARELGFDTDLAFKIPKAGADARAQVMNSYKRNASTTTLLVRVGSYYAIDAGQAFKLTPDASALLQRDPRGFLQRCGDAVVTKLQYRAEVIGLMKFDTNDQEKATQAAGGVGVQAPSVGTIADANAKVNGTFKQMKASTSSSMNLELYTQGFTPDGNVSLQNLQGDQAMERLTELLKTMAVSVKGDRERDVKAVLEGRNPVMGAGEEPQATGKRAVLSRNARLGAITFHAYAKRESTSAAALTGITQEAGKFLLEVGDVQGRMENAYWEEVNAFLTANDQEAYNLASGAKATIAELEPIAQKWAGQLAPKAGDNNVSSKLKDASLNCVRLGMSGDFSQCKRTDAIGKLIDEGKKTLDQYNAEGRIVRMNILYASTGEVVADKAKAACTGVGGRLPADTEMNWLKPALTAKGGFAWVQTTKCEKGIGIYTGASTPTCYSGMYVDWYDNVLDATGLSKRAAPVFCVAKNGPKGALPRVGE